MNMKRVVLLLVLFSAPCHFAPTRGTYTDRQRWPSYTPSTQPPRRSALWSALHGCPSDVYKYNRLDCSYNNGFYFYSSRHNDRDDDFRDAPYKEKSKSRSMQAKIELEKFKTNWYRPGITGNNAIKL